MSDFQRTYSSTYFDESWATVYELQAETGVHAATFKRNAVKFEDPAATDQYEARFTAVKDGAAPVSLKPWLVQRGLDLYEWLNVRGALPSVDVVDAVDAAERVYDRPAPPASDPARLRMVRPPQNIDADLPALPGSVVDWAAHTDVDLRYPPLSDAERALAAAIEADGPDEEPGYNGINWIVDKAYLFDDEIDEYEVILAAAGNRKMLIPGQAVRDFRRLYCAEKKSLNQIAMVLGMPRSWVDELRRTFNITKDALPFTDEEVEATSVEHLEIRGLDMKKRVVQTKLEKRHIAEIEQDAEKWRNAEAEVTALSTMLLAKMPGFAESLLASVPRVPTDRTLPRGLVIGNIQDSHLGKSATLGDCEMVGYSDAIVSEFVVGLAKARKIIAIEEVVMTLGGDTSDTDTSKGTTTSGRPMLSSVTPERVHYEAIRQQMRLVAASLQVCDRVILKFVPGNHDKLTGWIAAMAVGIAFQNDPRVEFDFNWHQRQYHRYAEHLFMLTHEVSGDVARYIGETFMAEAGGLVAQTRYRHVYTGHLHHEVVSEDKQGVTRRQAPAPVPNDDYHIWQWPNARRQIQLVAHEAGSTSESVFNQDVGQHYAASPTISRPVLPALPSTR